LIAIARSQALQLSFSILFPCLAKFDKVSGSAIWDKSPQSVVADQTLKKALIKRADTRLVAEMASSSENVIALLEKAGWRQECLLLYYQFK